MKTPPTVTELHYCIYARKSSEAEDRQAMSIGSQLQEMEQVATRDGLNIVDIKTESKSAKETGKRNTFAQMITDIQEGKYNAILTWAPDRLSRNAGDLGLLVGLMDAEKLVEIRTHGQTITNTPNEKFLLMILCSQAKLENDNRAKNVKRGLRAKCQMGKRPGLPPLGYKLWRDPDNYSAGSQIILDEERAPFIRKMFEYVALNDYSGRQTWEYICEEGLRTRKGKEITLSMAYRFFKDTFYYGEFEYPKGSGNWYTGTHKPIITKELYNTVQKKLLTYEKSKWGSRTFYFTKLFKCGNCGSGVCGESRVNRHRKTYVYYRCNRFGGKGKCRQKYIREEKLIESVAKLVDNKRVTEQKLNDKVLRELQKYNAMQQVMSGQKSEPMNESQYIQYVLLHGSSYEKKEFLNCLQGKLQILDGEVKYEENRKNSNMRIAPLSEVHGSSKNIDE